MARSRGTEKNDGKGGFVVDYRDASTLYLGKVLFMWACVFLDIFFNSAVDHDELFTHEQIRFMSVVGQVTTQILILFAFALLLSGTYIVQVGLVGQLWGSISAMGVVSLVYIPLTLGLSYWKMELLRGSNTMLTLWEPTNQSFYVLFVIHKLVAALFYVIVARVAIRLGEPIFYSPKPWMRLYKRQPNLFVA